MNIGIHEEQGNVPVTVLRPEGRIDGQNYRELIAKAAERYGSGVRNLLLVGALVLLLAPSTARADWILTPFVGTERLPAVPVTVQYDHRPETEVIASLLRTSIAWSHGELLPWSQIRNH